MSRRSHIAVIPEVAQTSVCVPVNHIARDSFTKIAATLLHCRRSGIVIPIEAARVFPALDL